MWLIRECEPRKRRLERKPVVEWLESRVHLSADLISTPNAAAVHAQKSDSTRLTLISTPPVAGQPWSPSFRFEKFNPQTPAKDVHVGIHYGDEPGAVTPIKKSESGKRFVIFTGPEHTYQNPGPVTLVVTIIESGKSTHFYDFPLTVSPPSNTTSTPPLSGAGNFFLGNFSGSYDIPMVSANGNTISASGTISLSLESIRFTEQVATNSYVADINDSINVAGPWGQTGAIPFSTDNQLDLDYETSPGNFADQIVVSLNNGSNASIELNGSYSNGVITFVDYQFEIDGYENVNNDIPITLSGAGQPA